MAKDTKEAWLDKEAINNLKTTLGEEVYKDLLKEFFSYCEESFHSLNISYLDKDFISIEDIAHNLKSNSLVYGLEKLSKEAKALELYSSKQDIAKVTEVYNNLKGIYKKSLELLKANE